MFNLSPVMLFQIRIESRLLMLIPALNMRGGKDCDVLGSR
jgi:hypothetical protein